MTRAWWRAASGYPPRWAPRWSNRIDAHTDREYREAWQQGGRESRAAHAADALVELLSGHGESNPSRAELVVVVDLDALLRGHAHVGERSHIPGVGPLPVTVARRIASDAFLKAVVVDGCEIRKVKHFGRRIPAVVRTALELGSAPELDGASCVEEGCGRPHHRDKTERDRQAGLLYGRDSP